jgi:hypothetical protein
MDNGTWDDIVSLVFKAITKLRNRDMAVRFECCARRGKTVLQTDMGWSQRGRIVNSGAYPVIHSTSKGVVDYIIKTKSHFISGEVKFVWNYHGTSVSMESVGPYEFHFLPCLKSCHCPGY